jgi:DNA-binding transcriptional MocR family regulator
MIGMSTSFYGKGGIPMAMMGKDDKERYEEHLEDLKSEGALEKDAYILTIYQVFADEKYKASYMRLSSPVGNGFFIWIEDDESWTTRRFSTFSDIYKHAETYGNLFRVHTFTPIRGGNYEFSSSFTLELSGRS